MSAQEGKAAVTEDPYQKKRKVGTQDWDSDDDATLQSLLQKMVRTDVNTDS